MGRNEKHIPGNGRELNRAAEYTSDTTQIEESMPAKRRNIKCRHTSKVNRLWLWFGVLVLIFLLLYWLFSIGIMEDLLNVFNG